MQLKRRILGLVLALSLAVGLGVPARAADTGAERSYEKAAAFTVEALPAPKVSSIGGEWAVIGLRRGGAGAPEGYYQTYYAALEGYTAQRGGVLHEKKYTEHSRAILAVTALGRDARDVAGHDLTLPLGDYDKTVWQGVNGPIWALIALDSGDYPIPANTGAETQATRQMYIDYILNGQLPDGSWSLSGGGDPDLTAMALTALARYRQQGAVQAAVDRGTAWLSARQNGDGGFSSWGTANSESCAQVIVALCGLGIPLDDPRFVKNGNTALDALLSYQQGDGGFAHVKDGGSDQMATEQALCALAAARRAAQGESPLYHMDDAAPLQGDDGQKSGGGLPGKDPAVKAMPVVAPGKTFADISGGNGHKNRTAIEAMAARGMISGRSDTLFAPDANMTRAEFAAIVVGSLGLTPEAAQDFSDVAADRWYAPYIGTAFRYGIVQGVGGGRFAPEDTITRQEAAVMVCRAAELCGMDTAMDGGAARDVLAQFGDYMTAAGWARGSLAFCYDKEILDPAELDIRPRAEIKRCEVAEMLYQLLKKAALL